MAQANRVVSVDGTEIVYFTTGDGPPLLLVHGTTADHTRWAPLLPYLERHATIHGMDRRGRGASGDASEYALEREFEDVATVIEDVADHAAAPVDVYGHSYGALCSLGAATLTTRIRKLVVYEPPGRRVVGHSPKDVHERIERLIADGDREGALTTFLREIVRMPEEQLEPYRAQPSWEARIAAAHTIVREEVAPAEFNPDRVRALTVPTLMIVGGDSDQWMRKDADAIVAALPDVRVIELPGQQHVADVLIPEVFARHVVDFLGDHA